VVRLAIDHGFSPGEGGRIVIDDGGLGGGVVDRLRELGWGVRSVSFGQKPVDERRFVNARAEMYWQLREWIAAEAALSTAPAEISDELLADLTAAKYETASDGRILIEAKKEIKRRLGRSPDLADALALALVPRIAPPILNLDGLRERNRKGPEDPDDPREDSDHPGHAAYCREHEWDDFRVNAPEVPRRRTGQSFYG
jgi:hypothetical protein